MHTILEITCVEVMDFLNRIPGMGKHLGTLVQLGYHNLRALTTLDDLQLVEMVSACIHDLYPSYLTTT